MTSAAISVDSGPPESVRPLRQIVLRPGQSAAACVYPGDDDPETVHFSAVRSGELVGIASLYRERSPKSDDEHAWRLRGMATSNDVRGTGVGGQLLQTCIDHARGRSGTLLWCNARIPAAGFYRRYGFKSVGEVFELPEIGPHVYMHLAMGE